MTDQHPTSLWECLDDMSAYMPSAKDRRKLKDDIAKNRAEEHRIRIWDYFFRPNPDHVGKSILRELSGLRAQVAQDVSEGTQRLEYSLNALAKLERTRQNELAAVNAQLHAIETQTEARENDRAQSAITFGSILAGASVAVLILLLGLRLVGAASEKRDAAMVFSGCFLGLWFLLGLPVTFIGLGIRISGQRKRAPERISALVVAQQKQIRDGWAHRELVLKGETEKHRAGEAAARETLERAVPYQRSQIATLESRRQALLDEIPKPPTVGEVQTWLTNDIDELLAIGAEELGVVGQTIKIGGQDQFVIRGPAEIQDPKLMPLTYGKDPDRKKYLHARRLGRTDAGRPYQHYGVFSLEILYITGDVLARYSVLFDFIRGVRVRESAPQQHLADVVTTEMLREDRQIPVNGEMTDLERVPSMNLALNNGDRISITLATEQYFAALDVPEAASNDAFETADNALKVITHCVKEAKKRLEVTKLARTRAADQNE
jgi:hypothetical protein